MMDMTLITAATPEHSRALRTVPRPMRWLSCFHIVITVLHMHMRDHSRIDRGREAQLRRT